MPVRDHYDHGTPSWIDLNTSDTAAAKTFYTALFGWTAHDIPVSEGVFYTMLKLGDRDVAALSAQQPSQDGVPPHWNTYITVDDVDAAAATVAELGGALHMPPFDVMDAGRMAVVQDPTGASFCLWTAKKNIGAGRVNEPGALTWNELLTDKVDRAGTFYAGLLGWDLKADGGSPDYIMLTKGERMLGGMMGITPEMGPMPSNWMTYFGAADCDATAAKAAALGGTLLMPPKDFPGVGRGAVIQDPQGAVFSIIQLNTWPAE